MGLSARLIATAGHSGAVLESTSDHATRDKLALRLADARVPGTPEILLRLIAREELADHRGTLVYSLGHFDCSAYFPTLVHLVATANFEVAWTAFHILKDLDHVAGSAVGAGFAEAKSAVSLVADDWRRELLEDLIRGFE